MAPARLLLLLAAFAALFGSALAVAPKCPAGCFCSGSGSGSGSSGGGSKVECYPMANGGVDFASLPPDTVHLDLAKYGLKELTTGMFAATPRLEKLDLQNNGIEHVEEGAFDGLRSLQVLDMSRNGLEFVNSDMFSGLVSLQRLKITGNRIQTVESGAFDDLRALQKLDISENPFVCDCNLEWFLRWLEIKKDILGTESKTKCSQPTPYADAPLLKVNPESLPCVGGVPDSVAGPRLPREKLTLIPSGGQVVVAGDRLEVACKVNTPSRRVRVKWFIRGKEVGASKEATVTTEKDFQDGSELSVLTVESLRRVHSGEWTCQLEDGGAEFRRSTNVLVIGGATRLCQPFKASTAQGDYSFGTAIGGHTVQQPCEKPLPIHPFGFAYLLCQENGEWASALNTSHCAYTSQVTDALQKFATMNMTFNKDTRLVLDSARQFVNFTDDPSVFKDPMDLVYYARAVNNYLPHLTYSGEELGHLMLSMVENILDVEGNALLAQAQLRDRAMSRLLGVVTNVTAFLPAFKHQMIKLAAKSYDIRPESFDGVTCTWYETLSAVAGYQTFVQRRDFHCAETNQTLPTTGKRVLASVALPKSIYGHMMSVQRLLSEERGGGILSTRDGRRIRNRNRLVFSAYNTSALFPDDVGPKPPSFVIGVEHVIHDEGEFGNLVDPINVVISSSTVEGGDSFSPQWWDSTAENGFGAWRSEYCKLVEAKNGLIWFKCWRIGYYRFVTVASEDVDLQPASFRFLHPVVYVGASVGIVLLVTSVIVYCISLHSILISRKLKHSMINFWISCSALLFLYATGMNQTESEVVCKGVGVASHFLTLSCLSWLVISVRVIYRKANKQRLSNNYRRSYNAATTLLSRGNPPPPSQSAAGKNRRSASVARYYLAGWGVSGLICGLVAAEDLNNYGTPTHCFVRLVPFLAGVILPLAMVTALILGFSLSAWCIVSTSPSHITEQLDADKDSHEEHDLRAVARSPSISPLGTRPDLEKTVKSLLLSHAYIYVLFLSTYMCGCLVVLEPLKGNLPHEELIFALLFSVSSISLGVFVFVYFCASRQDVQECWRSPYCVSYVGRRQLRRAAAGGVDTLSNQVKLNSQHQQGIPLPPPGVGQPSSDAAMGPDFHVMPGGGMVAGGLLGGNEGGVNHVPEMHQQRGQHNESYKIYEGSSLTRFHTVADGGMPPPNHPHPLLSKASDMSSSDRPSLNHLNHLRRGYVAPVNSEADYGIYTGPPSSIFGPPPPQPAPSMISTDLNLQPKTSSPAAGVAIPVASDQVLPVSPLDKDSLLQTTAARDLDNPDYTETSTIKVGVPCQMASLSLMDLPPGHVPNDLTPSRVRQHRPPRKHSKERDDDAIERVSDLERLETISKGSGVSSAYSSGRSGRKKRRHKKPTRRRQQRTSEEDVAALALAGDVARHDRSRRLLPAADPAAALDDDNLGDDDGGQAQQADFRAPISEEAESASESLARQTLSEEANEEEAATTSQYSSSDMPTRETSV